MTTTTARTRRIRPARRTAGVTYAVRDVVALAQEVAKTGKEMLFLNIGDPNRFDFETPPHLIEAVLKAMRDNHNGYSPSSGLPAAVKAVEREAQRSGISNIRDVFVTSGGSEAIELCLTALVDKGDNVLIPYPGYPLYEAVLAKLEAEAKPYFLDESRGWQPDPEDIRKRIDSKTRAIVLINPNNPTGAVYERETLRRILALAASRGVLVFADEIYDQLLLSDQEHVSIASLDAEAPVITFNGLSKNFLAPGWRIGWGVVSGNEGLLKDFVPAINKLLRARLCASHPMQHAITAALDGRKEFLARAREKLIRRRDITHEMLNSAPGISCVKADAAFYAFPKLDIKGSDEEFVKGLIRETGVVTVHGSGFGEKPGTKHLRVVFLPQEEVLRKAYANLLAYLKKIRGS
ncbi:MAG: aminotransferase class I/II-fold pyridoxal phosphate-dependent enzyme [Elusimicrobia bacterium]|nr:aminotransferase class I/II-fold pyridoxal phosphate-dependent enzyme [Elusimicrobiota bacterium]